MFVLNCWGSSEKKCLGFILSIDFVYQTFFLLLSLVEWADQTNGRPKHRMYQLGHSENRKCGGQQKDIERKREKTEWWRQKGLLWPQAHGAQWDRKSFTQTNTQALCPLIQQRHYPKRCRKEQWGGWALSLPYTHTNKNNFLIKLSIINL